MEREKLINRLLNVPCWAIGTETEGTMLDAVCALEAADKLIAELEAERMELIEKWRRSEARIADLETALAACRVRAAKGRECRFDCDFYDWTVGTCGGECVMLCKAERGEHDE